MAVCNSILHACVTIRLDVDVPAALVALMICTCFAYLLDGSLHVLFINSTRPEGEGVEDLFSILVSIEGKFSAVYEVCVVCARMVVEFLVQIL